MVTVPEQVSVSAAVASVLSELERIFTHWDKSEEQHWKLFLMEKMSLHFSCLTSVRVLSSFGHTVCRSNWSKSAYFFLSACPFPNSFQWSLFRCLCAAEHLACQVNFVVMVLTSHNNFQHFVIQLIWKNSRLLLLSLALDSDRHRHFSANHGNVRERVFLLAALCCDITTSLLAVETSDVPFVLKLASGNLTSWAAGDAVSRLESSWDGPVYTAATFPATVWSHRESLVQTGLKERERQQTR